MNPQPTNSAARFAATALWVAAGVLLGLLFFRGGDSEAQQVIRGLRDSARAGAVTHSGTFAMLTNETNNEDMLIILDQRTESLLVYRTDLQKGMELQQRLGLPRVFEDARVRTQGRQ